MSTQEEPDNTEGVGVQPGDPQAAHGGPEEPTTAAAATYFEVLNEHYRNDFRLFWMRTNFFLLIEVGLLGFYHSERGSRSLLVIVSGISVAVVWFVVSYSSFKWIHTWRKQVVKAEALLGLGSAFGAGERVRGENQPWWCRVRPEAPSLWIPGGLILLWVASYLSGPLIAGRVDAEQSTLELKGVLELDVSDAQLRAVLDALAAPPEGDDKADTDKSGGQQNGADSADLLPDEDGASHAEPASPGASTGGPRQPASTTTPPTTRF